MSTPAPDPFDLSTVPRNEAGFPLCFACQPRGGCRLGIERLMSGPGPFTAELTCPSDQQGGPAVAHGGWTASVLDEVLGHAAMNDRGRLTVTGRLTVDYVKPVPVGVPLLVTAQVGDTSGRRSTVDGELRLSASGALLARATGVFVARDRDHFARHSEWLAEQGRIRPA
jgi:acyl-coenzyme A thioesterase PaaI-like protein